MYYIISLLVGGILAFMVSCNGIVGTAAGNYASSVIIHFIGLIGVVIILLHKKLKFKNLRAVPFFMYSAGIIGIGTVLLNNLTYTTLGVSLTVALSLLGQSLTSIAIDHFGLFGMPVIPFNKKKLVGFLLIGMGIVVMILS